MNITFSFDPQFDELMLLLKSKYGERMFELEGIGSQLDLNQFAKSFFKTTKVDGVTADVSIDSNANVTNNDSMTFRIESSKPHHKLNSLYKLWKKLKEMHGPIVAKDLIEGQISGALYINDAMELSMPYCFNFSCMDIAMQGLPMVNKIHCAPPKYLTSFKSQVEQFLNVASNMVLGATGLADILIVMAHYVDKILDTMTDDGFRFVSKKDVWKYVKSMLTSLVYTLNQPIRAGVQSPFVNISVYDSVFLAKLVDGYVFPDYGTPKIATVREIQKIFLDIMNQELERTPVTFPVVTACFATEHGKILDEEFARFIARKNMRFGFINMFCGPTSVLSSCCRLRSETDANEYHNSFGAGSSKIGSLGVVTINFPRIAYLAMEYAKANQEANQYDVFLQMLDSFVRSGAVINLAKRELIKDRIAEKGLPLYDLGFMDLSQQYLTVGINGMAEACEVLGTPVTTKEYRELMSAMIDRVNAVLDDLNTQHKSEKIRFNCEQTPSENSAIKLAEKDFYLGYNRDEDGNKRWHLYSNQFIPLTSKANLLDRINIQGMLDSKFSGGAIAHINVEQQVTDPAKIYELIRVCAKKGVVYWAINYNLQRCGNGHMTVGKKDECPECGEKILENFTRVVGFVTNTKHWHVVRRGDADYQKRLFY